MKLPDVTKVWAKGEIIGQALVASIASHESNMCNLYPQSSRSVHPTIWLLADTSSSKSKLGNELVFTLRLRWIFHAPHFFSVLCYDSPHKRTSKTKSN